MKKNKLKPLLPSLCATAVLAAFGVTLLLLHTFSQYPLYRLSGIFLLTLALIELLLIAFGKPKAAETAEPMPDAPSEAESEPVAEAVAEPEAESESERSGGKKHKRHKRGRGKLFKALWRGLTRLAKSAAVWLLPLLLLAVLIIGSVWFGASLWAQPTSSILLAYWHLALVAIFFVVAVVGDNLCRHADAEDARIAMLNRNVSLFFKLTKLITVLIAAPLALSLLGLIHIHVYIGYALAVLFYYVIVMTFVSLAVRAFKRELSSTPGIVILLPFLGGDIKELAVLSFLEENTGITLRSLWSLKFIKHIIPYSVIAAALLFWASTGLVYVTSNQQAAVYRLGVLQEQTLTPGLHMTLPYPLDRSEIYDTATINKVTIGYRADDSEYNVWTENHGSEEYRLLLGSGDELVSINLRLEYRISDLKLYLRSSSAPEKIMEAKAYELVTARTINTDLEDILSTNRETFSATLHEDLKASLNEVGSGIEVVSVVLESIHPPVEVAEVYHKFIAAEIRASKYLLDAQGTAAEIRANALSVSDSLLTQANIDHYSRVADATTEINAFMAAIEASEQYPDEYKYYKYLDAIRRAYKNAKLVIVGNDVDSSRIYFGDIPTQVQ